MGKRIRPSGSKPEPPRPAVNRIHTPVSISFARVAIRDQFCLSHCNPAGVREVVDCLRQLTTLSWQQVLQTGGKGKNKAGLGYTPYPDTVLTRVSRPTWLSDDIRIAGLRASREIRIFGFYIDHTFYVLWFDRNHEIVPG